MEQSKKPTIRDVAREAGVSISVVSYVLNQTPGKTIRQETKKRVINAAEKLHYVPDRFASGMRTKRAKSIGIVSHWRIDSDLFVQFLRGVERVTSQNGYSVMLCNLKDRKDTSYIDHYLDRRVDGILFISPYDAIDETEEQIHISCMQQAGVPFSVINGHTNLPDINRADFDFYGSAYLATEYLIKKGHRQITYVAPVFDTYAEFSERKRGYAAAMAAHGLAQDYCPADQIAARIEDFCAVVANKSDTAHRIICEAHRRGLRIPERFALIAANTERYSSFLFPPLTTVSMQADTVSEVACKLLMDTILGTQKKRAVVVPCVLTERDSC